MNLEKCLAMFSVAVILIAVGATLSNYTVEYTREVDGIKMTGSEYPYAPIGGALTFVGLIWLAISIVKTALLLFKKQS
jgi:uncharacterized membrane protein YgdD (TMEM256/DUF423 family)